MKAAKSSSADIAMVQAETADQIAAARELMLEYAQWLEFNLCFQGFEEELRTLPGKYAPPKGRLLLVYVDQQLAGMGALRPMDEAGVCEMKRLYVRPGFRGYRLGWRLAERLILEAGEIGYERMRLDTVPGKMDSAIALYRELGFHEIPGYYATPVNHTLFMEVALPHRSRAD
jgi:ribosomal protein S18 acetylase RimI-like enzyme